MNKTKYLYDNCKIYDPNNNLLGYCNKNRIQWYVRKNLATYIDTEQKEIRLNFLPSSWKEHPPSLIKKENICVNCGIDDNLTKHHIVPRVYLKHFPLHIKSNNSHDVVLLCADCHTEYELDATVLKRELGAMYNCPIDFKKEYTKLYKAYSCLRQLFKYQKDDNWMHNKMILNMMFTVETYYPNVTYTDNDLIYLETEIEKIKSKSHGKVIVENYKDLQKFSEMWREHFIETMDPFFMPEGWDIKTKIK